MIAKLLQSFTGPITEGKKTILRNTAWLTGAEMMSRILRGILSIVAARMLGTEGLGVFSYAIALGGFLTFFEDVGIGTYVTRSYARNDQNKQNVFGTALVLKLLLGLTALAVFIGLGPVFSAIPESNIIIPIVALLMFSDQLRGFFFTITRAEERMHVDAIVQIITNVLIAILGIGALAITARPLFLAFGYLTGSVIGTIIMMIVIRNYIPNIRNVFQKDLFKEIVTASWPFTILAISNVLIFNTDSIFLGYYGTPTDVGLYGAASRLVMMFYILASLFSVVTFPSLVQKIAQGIPIRAAIKKSLLLMILITIPLITGMTFGSSLIMQILFGASFVAAAPILAILSLTYIPVFTRSVLNNAILAKNIQRKFVWANIAGVMVNIGLDFLLVPHYLGVGAAIASVAGLTTISVATAVILWKK
jgi:PST family polysaccharide transporter